jgi:hypothetical protein
MRKTERILSVNVEDGSIEITSFTPSNMCFASGDVIPGTVLKKTYKAVDNKIVLVSTVEGRHVPSHVIPEQFIFTEST